MVFSEEGVVSLLTSELTESWKGFVVLREALLLFPKTVLAFSDGLTLVAGLLVAVDLLAVDLRQVVLLLVVGVGGPKSADPLCASAELALSAERPFRITGVCP